MFAVRRLSSFREMIAIAYSPWTSSQAGSLNCSYFWWWMYPWPYSEEHQSGRCEGNKKKGIMTSIHRAGTPGVQFCSCVCYYCCVILCRSLQNDGEIMLTANVPNETLWKMLSLAVSDKHLERSISLEHTLKRVTSCITHVFTRLLPCFWTCLFEKQSFLHNHTTCALTIATYVQVR